jgi:hypothetical protein
MIGRRASYVLQVMGGGIGLGLCFLGCGGRLFDDTGFLWWIWIFGLCSFMQSMAGGIASVKLLFLG